MDYVEEEMTLEEMQDLYLCDVSEKTRTKILAEVEWAFKNYARGTSLYIEDEDERNAFRGYFLGLEYMVLTWPGEEDSPYFEVRWTY